MKDIMELVNSLEILGLLVEGVSEAIENETKEKSGFLGMLWGTVAPSLFRNMLTDKAKIPAQVLKKVSKETNRAGQKF